LNDECGASLRAIRDAKESEVTYIELYTNSMPDLSLKRLEVLIGKRPQTLSRDDLEDSSSERILKEASIKRVALLVPGDPMIATTHIALRIAAERMGIKTRVVHGASIISAAIGLSGLQNYKFGRSVTIPFPGNDDPSETPYEVLRENRSMGLHTLVFLDVRVEEGRSMRIHEGLGLLSSMESKRREGVISEAMIVVGVARAGSDRPVVKAGGLRELLTFDFGDTPHTLIFPGKLHFMEEEALKVLGGYQK
jgi:diphthine synthase